MSVDLLPVQKVHSRSISDLDLLPVSGIHADKIRSYLIACAGGDKSSYTVAIYKNALTYFAEWCGSRPLTRDTLRLYVAYLNRRRDNREITGTTANGYFRPLRSWCSWLVAEGLIERDANPCINVDAPKLPKTTIKPIKPDEVRRMLEMCAGDRFTEIRNRAILMLFYDSIMRLKELAAIQLKDINMDEQAIFIEHGKGDKERVSGFSKDTKAALMRYLLLRKDKHDCLWITEERQPMSKAGVQMVIKRLCYAVGASCKHGPHALRHGGATSMVRGGCDIKILKELLGHSTLTMANHYVETITSEDAVKAHRQFSPVERLKKK